MDPASAPSVTRNTKNARSGIGIRLRDHHGCHEALVEKVRVRDARLGDLSRRLDRDDLPNPYRDAAWTLLERDGLHARLDRFELPEPVRSDRRVAAKLRLLGHVRPPDGRAQGRPDPVELAPIERSVEILEQLHPVFEGHEASPVPR